MKLSHSSVTRHSMCAHSYKLHYIDKIRPKVTSAALLVGSALDEAINALLLKSDDPLEVFEKSWSTGFINKNRVDIKTCIDVVYAEADFDSDILLEEDFEELSEFSNLYLPDMKGDVLEIFNEIKAIKKNSYKQWSTNQNVYFNLANWLSWKRKAKYILDAYREEVLPRIKNVVAVQKKIELSNGDDTIEGYIDLIAEMDDGKTYILDNKSSAREYEEDSPSTKPQLHLYAIAENNPNVGFIVYIKKLEKNEVRTCASCGNIAEGRHKTCDALHGNKRCGGEWERTVTPKAKIQVLLGETNKALEDIVLENFNDINMMIKNGVYPKNLNSCNNWYGSKCPYYNKCYANNEDGLETVE